MRPTLDVVDSFTASFLRAYAPIVGKAVNGEQPVYFTQNPLNPQHDDKLWDKTLDLPTFQYQDLLEVEVGTFHKRHFAVKPPN